MTKLMTPMIPNNATLFFDMDGVMALYEPEAYMESIDTKMAYLNHGYFRERTPDAAAVRLFRKCIDPYDRSHPHIDGVYVLSTVPADEPDRARIIADKRRWLEDYALDRTDEHEPSCFDIDERTIFAYSGSHPKSKVFAAEEMLGRPLTKADCLIDDFNANLKEWDNAGGTAIKYLNGINSPSLTLTNIDVRDITVNDAMFVIDSLAARALKRARDDIARQTR